MAPGGRQQRGKGKSDSIDA